LVGKWVAGVGMGSAILALAAARAGAASVVAVDINSNAAMAAAENTHTNGLGKPIMAVSSNLLSALTPCPLFDVTIEPPRLRANRATSPTTLGTRVPATAI
jgi:ribosomal protein L11 methylase PrmA